MKASHGKITGMNVVVIGGGVSGLVASRFLLQQGAHVVLLEREGFLGGMAASFEWDGIPLDRFYHFLCRGDEKLIRMTRDLGISKHLSWHLTSMGLNYQGSVYPFGTAVDLLRIPLLSLGSKLRFGIGIVRSRFKRGWTDLEDVPAPQWLLSHFGEEAYRLVHDPLISRKFGPYASSLSAAWIWARFHRLGRSRQGVFQRECLGYLKGGTQVLIDALAQEVRSLGGTLLTRNPVEEIVVQDEKVLGVRSKQGEFHAGTVLSTAPLPILPSLIPGISPDLASHLTAVPYIGVVCVLFRLRKGLSPHFWTNMSDPDSPLAGVIEYTNLDPKPELNGDRLVYLPRYLPCEDPVYCQRDEDVAQSTFQELERLYPGLAPGDMKAWKVFRYPFAQPICRTGFTRETVQIRTPIPGLYVTDSCLLHPSDRTITDTIDLAEKAGRMILEDGVSG